MSYVETKIKAMNAASGGAATSLPEAEQAYYEKIITDGSAVPAATTSVAGVVKQSAAVADFAGADAAAIVVELNAMLVKLRTAGIIAT